MHYVVAWKTTENIQSASVICTLGFCRWWQYTCTWFCPATLSSNQGI